jgi:hypothetical protein
METTPQAIFSHWESFYVIVGSSAAGLTGLMFVVITLVAGSAVLRRNIDAINAFGTPNVIHFVAALLISAILSAPWTRMRDPAHVIGLLAISGVVYVLIVWRRMQKQKSYKPVLEDWIWHLILPMIAYAFLFVSAAGVSHGQSWALFLVGATSLLLLSIGIHNAWDTVTYVVMQDMKEAEQQDKPK